MHKYTSLFDEAGLVQPIGLFHVNFSVYFRCSRAHGVFESCKYSSLSHIRLLPTKLHVLFGMGWLRLVDSLK